MSNRKVMIIYGKIFLINLITHRILKWWSVCYFNNIPCPWYQRANSWKYLFWKDLIIAFYKLTPRLLSYHLSFMTPGIFWTAHTKQFYFIEKSDRNYNWLNLSFLLFLRSASFISFNLVFSTGCRSDSDDSIMALALP